MNVSARPKITLWDYITGSARLVRMTNLVIVVVTQYFTRILLIGPRDEWRSIIANADMFFLSLSTVCIAAAGYIINDYFDIKIDIVNKPERVVVGRYLKRRWAMGAHQILNVLGAVLGLVVSPYIFVINVFSITLLWFYSERYKRLPFIGNFIVSLLTGFSLLILTVHFPANRHLVFIYAVFSFFISLVREIVKDMEDIKGDEAHGCRTLPIIWGIRQTKNFLYVILLMFVTTLFVMARALDNNVLIILFFLLLIPIALLTASLARADTRRDFKRISSLCKIIMLLGLITMVWA
ncbi:MULTISPECIES: geranylgeranylglycerol-phosphate geranylgeranyltransferase [Dyadobacter]|uniref:Geranylgeranylglycerol-phosphate geranylgeranyltransferase n=1 Tax=Dyadobacter chenhuakuii TaxID=2909339 RepID=A0A9X1QCS6_9BACT|nr:MULTISPECIES: geranylgeranylglycerol-phosphate geranylgeranyltransferase [Dyadobacter]MCF2494969.1 geranylgeranylglycerol-phosphate geranylgeranyltransferase [Dyadobacter chenhuakuii]MCF2498047.1 geranylgeranylglycerol-phosphate geranylgeranyltransferase [Dyadobacter chenhuakuii]MCF2518952.1 geranylgeranylglycerol-phosphate geranylgeranyltransferase [Dyadobacter sp. CY351]USJ31716.1 geranylgeranylglycerol-phosphate geranylgeranyltransferase [Dyadobacter chenhuakuii]